MLSSVVNSLTYCVLSHLFFTYLWHFFSNLYILLLQKTMKFVDFFYEIWLNYDWHFLHSLLEHFLEKAYYLCSVWFPNQQKCVYFGIFWHAFVLFCCETFLRTFSNYLSYVLFILFFKNHVFSCFSENNNYHDFPFRHCIVHDRMMVICASLWKFYLNIFLFFVENVIILYTLLCTYFV